MIGPERAKLAVVAANLSGEREPFAGAAGKLFKDCIAQAGIGVEKVAFGWASPSTFDELEGVGAEFVVLAGNDAVSLSRSDLGVGSCHGRVMLLRPDRFSIDGTLAFPVFHPEAFYRNPHWRSLLVEELELLKRIATDRQNWVSMTPDTCVRCRGEFFVIDDQGIVFCEEHKSGKLRPERQLTAAEVARLFDVTVTN